MKNFSLYKYFIVHKPYHVLSQFTSQEGKKTLKDIFDVPGDVYPVGRLDYDSEGLLILTNEKALNHYLLNPVHAHEREYWVQVENMVTPAALQRLKAGVDITINGKVHHAKSLHAAAISPAPAVSERIPPVRFRKNIPVSWISITLGEGKNRQVRRMTARVGFPTLRLIRYRIQDVTLGELAPGEMQELSQVELYNLLRIKKR